MKRLPGTMEIFISMFLVSMTFVAFSNSEKIPSENLDEWHPNSLLNLINGYQQQDSEIKQTAVPTFTSPANEGFPFEEVVDEKEWQAFKYKHQKSYGPTKDQFTMKIFRETKHQVAELHQNKMKTDMNKDLVQHDFTEMYKDGKSGKAGRRYNIPMLFGSMQPGLLYNAKADAPLIGLNLYDDPKLDEANITHTDSEVFLENTVIDRMTHFDLGASLALSFMGGLIKVEGSASYLDENVENQKTVRVTSKFNTKTKSYTLHPNQAPNAVMCGKKEATQVVSEVTYGFNSYFIFEKTVSNKTDMKKVEGDLHIFVDSIPGMTIDGKGHLNLTEDQKHLSQGLKFKYHGDGVIDRPPTTFVEAVRIIQAMPNMSHHYQRVVSFSLSPLTDFCETSDRILYELYESDMREVAKVLTDFTTSQQILNTLKDSKFSNDFLQGYGAMLTDLKTRNLNHLDNFKKGLREILPNIRNGTENRKKLAELLVGIHKSPFYYDKFYIMLNVRQKEVETVETIIYFKDLPDEVERVVDSHDNPCMAINEFAIVYELDILPKDPSTLGERYENGNYTDESHKWFMNISQVQRNQPLLKHFVEFSKNNLIQDTCFVINLNKVKTNDKPFSFKLFHQGNNAPFEPPGKVVEVKELFRGHLSYKMTIVLDKEIFLTEKFDDIKAFLIVDIKSINTQDIIQPQKFEFHRNTSTLDIELMDLTPATIYGLNMSIWIQKGYSYIGRGVAKTYNIMTRPNPPENLACRLAEDIHGTRLSWDDPSEMAPNNTVKYYNLTLELCEKMYTKCKKYEDQRTTSNTLSIKNLPEDKLFRANLDYVLKKPYFYEKHEFFGISPTISSVCNTSDAVDCKWGSWSQWSSCSKTCGNGVEQRVRERATKAKNGGKKCTGGDTERRSCTEGKCFKDNCNCQRIEVYSPGHMKYDYQPQIFGFYSPKFNWNGKAFYESEYGRGLFGIWWCGDAWWIGLPRDRGQNRGYGYDHNGQKTTCPQSLSGYTWSLLFRINGHLTFRNVGNGLKIRCVTNESKFVPTQKFSGTTTNTTAPADFPSIF